MAHPIRTQPQEHTARHRAAVRAYTDRLLQLLDQLRSEPLDEHRSTALVTHIVNNRSSAARRYADLEAVVVGSR